VGVEGFESRPSPKLCALKLSSIKPDTDPKALDSSSVKNTSSISGSITSPVSEALPGTIVTTEDTDSSESSLVVVSSDLESDIEIICFKND
jgi:hypothetical protein